MLQSAWEPPAGRRLPFATWVNASDTSPCWRDATFSPAPESTVNDPPLLTLTSSILSDMLAKAITSQAMGAALNTLQREDPNS